MRKILSNFLRPNNQLEQGNNFFLIGVFFLPTALPISGIFLLLSLIISFKNNELSLLKDNWNLPLFASIGLIVFSSINISFINTPSALLNYDISIIWLNLINWLPIFFYFWGFQNFLITDEQKLVFSKYLISGTFPVFFSFILQKFFSFNGPYKTLFGLIVWFQKPIKGSESAIAGLFSNPNYAAIWIVSVLPFVIALLKNQKFFNIKKLVFYFFCLLFVYMIILTGSRNGLLGIIISTICFFGLKKILVILIPLFSLISFSNFLLFFFEKDFKLFSKFIPNIVIDKLTEINTYSTRFDIWVSTAGRVIERPFLGWGSSTFPYLNNQNNLGYISSENLANAQHSHNIALELAHNFGIPLSILLITTVILILLRSWKIIFKKASLNNSNINKAFFTSSSIFFISHLSDITYYDGKITILISILLAGLKSIIDKTKTP